MTAQQLAQLLLPLLPKISIPLSSENIEVGTALYETLGAMTRGELILSKPAPQNAGQ